VLGLEFVEAADSRLFEPFALEKADFAQDDFAEVVGACGRGFDTRGFPQDEQLAATLSAASILSSSEVSSSSTVVSRSSRRELSFELTW
jgi:hypothetical protein